MIYSRTMSLWRRAALAVKIQREVIRRKDAEIRMLQRCIVEHQMGYISLVEAWRVSLDHPNVDLEEDLDQMLMELRWSIAQSQEFVV